MFGTWTCSWWYCFSLKWSSHTCVLIIVNWNYKLSRLMIKTISMYTLKVKVNFMVRDLLCIHHPTQDASYHQNNVGGYIRDTKKWDLFEAVTAWKVDRAFLKALVEPFSASEGPIAAIQLGTPWVRFSPFRGAGSKEAGAAGYRLQESPAGKWIISGSKGRPGLIIFPEFLGYNTSCTQEGAETAGL